MPTHCLTFLFPFWALSYNKRLQKQFSYLFIFTCCFFFFLNLFFSFYCKIFMSIYLYAYKYNPSFFSLKNKFLLKQRYQDFINSSKTYNLLHCSWTANCCLLTLVPDQNPKVVDHQVSTQNIAKIAYRCKIFNALTWRVSQFSTDFTS